MIRSMNTAKQASTSLKSASHAYYKAAKARRKQALKFWLEPPEKTYAQVGEKFGVSRQRAAIMVRKAMEELS